jgi:uncharacterized protein YecE (DUF72 family)
VLPVRTASFAFVRYIGHPDVEANAPLLDEWAEQMAAWLKEGATVYAFCHSPDQTYAPPICRGLLIALQCVPLDPLPWDEADRDTPIQLHASLVVLTHRSRRWNLYLSCAL